MPFGCGLVVNSATIRQSDLLVGPHNISCSLLADENARSTRLLMTGISSAMRARVCRKFSLVLFPPVKQGTDSYELVGDQRALLYIM